jgi:hypothetical protein
MRGYPGFKSAAERAAYLLRHHRFPEIPFDQLTPGELGMLVVALRRELARTQRHAIVAHARGILLTACFLVLGMMLFGIGPAVHLSFFPVLTREALMAGGTLWVAVIFTTVLGAETADYVLRRRLRVARMWEHAAHEIQHAIARAMDARNEVAAR